MVVCSGRMKVGRPAVERKARQYASKVKVRAPTILACISLDLVAATRPRLHPTTFVSGAGYPMSIRGDPYAEVVDPGIFFS